MIILDDPEQDFLSPSLMGGKIWRTLVWFMLQDAWCLVASFSSWMWEPPAQLDTTLV